MAGSAIGAQQGSQESSTAATPAAGDTLRSLDRNPLATLCSAAQLLGVSDLPEHEQRLGRDVFPRPARRWARLVDELPDASRIIHGRIELLRQAVDLVAAIHTAVEGTRALMERSGHPLIASLDRRNRRSRGRLPAAAPA